MLRPKNEWELLHTVGVPCEEEPEKIRGLSEEEYRKLKTQCDVLLVEADGAKRKPLKVPAEHEPVIPEDTDMVIGIAGASASWADDQSRLSQRRTCRGVTWVKT